MAIMGQLTRAQSIGIVTLLTLVTGWVGVTALHTAQPPFTPGIVVRESHPTTDRRPSPSPSTGSVSENAGALPSAPTVAPPETAPPATEIVVHVAGAVMKPGVYHLKLGARNVDAVHAAGGFASTANPDAINLAAPCADSSQVYIPSYAEQPSGGSGAHGVGTTTSVAPSASGVVPASSGGGAKGAHGGSHSSGKFSDPSQGQVNLNTADAAQLQHIPGIGPAMADRILAYRRTAGRFQSPDELLQISGIGDKKYQKMKPYINMR